MITSFVLVMMLIIEYINIQTKGIWIRSLQKAKWAQLLISALLGAIPGCLGAYAVVSLYTHNIISFGALVSAMIATSGDEAFVLISMIPGTALKIIVSMLVIGIIGGVITNLFVKTKHVPEISYTKLLHEDSETCKCFDRKNFINNFRHLTFPRAILLFFLLIFTFLIISGEVGHNHGGHNHGGNHHQEWDWIRITFLSVTLVALFIIATVPDHFLEEHLWEHIIKKHFLRMFLWIMGTLIVIHLLIHNFDIESWIKNNQLPILLIAVLIGVIPVSGPHLVFITLFISGNIPLSILLANSIVQDGHGSLPLLAESKKSFFLVKIINIGFGLTTGLIGLYTGW
jgi:hypothetical protein